MGAWGGVLSVYAAGVDEQSAVELGLSANCVGIFPCVHARAIRADSSDREPVDIHEATVDVSARGGG